MLTYSRQIKFKNLLWICVGEVSTISNNGMLIPYFRLWTNHVWLMSFMISSTYNLVMLTFERYIGIIHPIWHKVHIGKQG